MKPRLDDGNEVRLGVEEHRTEGLGGVQGVAQLDGAARAQLAAPGLEPALGGGATVVRVVLRLHELGRQRQDLGQAGSDHQGGQDGVEVLVSPLLAAAAGAVLVTVDLVGFPALDAIESDEQAAGEALEGVQALALLQDAQQAQEQGAEGGGAGDGVEQGADAGGPWDGLQAAEGPAVGGRMELQRSALEAPQGGALQEEAGEGTEDGGAEGVLQVGAVACVGEGGDGGARGPKNLL